MGGPVDERSADQGGVASGRGNVSWGLSWIVRKKGGGGARRERGWGIGTFMSAGPWRDETQPQPPDLEPATQPVPIVRGRGVSGARAVSPLFPLAAVRRFAGLTEADVADRMGEPDTALVVHMESGADCAVSELEAYACALGGEIEIRITLPGWTYRVR